ncbi:MAG TPA: anti-sigma factor, partial [Acidimicrobiales bacterium]|nr:anti-sigma factor [Acidimicrobiales bacterium]
MSTDMEHDEIIQLLGPYALDALDPDEAAAVDAHLRDCPRCQAEVDAHREVAAALATGAVVDDAEPLPPGLWDRIADRMGARPASGPIDQPRVPQFRPPSTVDREGGSEASGGAVADGRRLHPDGAPDGLGQATVEPRASVADLSARRARSRRGLRWAAAATAVAAIAAIALLGVNLADSNDQLGQTRAALSAGGSAAAVQAALADPAHHLVRLDSPGGTQLAEFVVVPDGRGYLVSSSMPSLPGDQTYQLWGIIRGQPISLGLLGSNPRQATFTVASSSRPSSLAVTVEP